MTNCTEIHADIALTLQEEIPDKEQTVVKVGPSIYPTKRPQVYYIHCGDAEVIWHRFSAAGINRAFDCEYGTGSKKAASLIDKQITGISPEEDDLIPVDFERDKSIIEDIIGHMEESEFPAVEINY